MKTLKFITALAITLAMTAFAVNIELFDDEYLGTGYAFEENIPAFYLQDERGEIVSLPEFADSEDLIVIFTTPENFSTSAEKRELKRLNRKYKKMGYKVILVNAARSTEKKEAREEENLKFLYLIDEKQKQYANRMASESPLIYMLQKDGESIDVKPLSEF